MKKSALDVKHKKGKFKQSISSALFLSPSFLGVMIFFILPFLVVIYYSVIDNPINTQFVGMDNYSALVKNGAFTLAAKNTAIFSGIAVPLVVVLSLLCCIRREKLVYEKKCVIFGSDCFNSAFYNRMQ